MRLGRSILRSLQQHSGESKVEKEKAKYKDELWSKVNGWLQEYDRKEEEEGNPIDEY